MNHQPHPDIDLHKHFLSNLTQLELNIKNSKASIPDILYNFFIQFISAIQGEIEEPLKTLIRNAVETDKDYICPRVFAAKQIHQISYIEWPDKFLGKIYLSDIRNRVVFEIWKHHRFAVDTKWTPQTKLIGTKEQNESYLKNAHCIGSKLINPKNIEQMGLLLSWLHILKLIYHVKSYLSNTEIEYDTDDNIYTFNTFSGACIHKYKKYGMSKLIWELFLDIWTYDNVG